MEMCYIFNETHSWIMCNLLVSCTLEIFFMCLCSAIYMICIHVTVHLCVSFTCAVVIYLNLLVCCILVSMLVLCNLHELELYTCDCSPMCFIYLCSCNLLEFTCVLHTCVNACALQFTWVRVVYMWLFTYVFHILVQLQFTCVLHTCVNACALQFTWVRVVYMWLFTSVFHILVQLQFTCVLHTCVSSLLLDILAFIFRWFVL